MNRYTAAVAAAFTTLDLSAIAELQSDGKVEDRLRDDLMLAMRRAGVPVTKGGPQRFDLYVPDEWAFELKMMYFGDHASELRGSRADVVKLRNQAPGMIQVLATIVSWHSGSIYPRARQCLHNTDRKACVAYWAELLSEISGQPISAYQRDELVLFLTEL